MKILKNSVFVLFFMNFGIFMFGGCVDNKIPIFTKPPSDCKYGDTTQRHKFYFQYQNMPYGLIWSGTTGPETKKAFIWSDIIVEWNPNPPSLPGSIVVDSPGLEPQVSQALWEYFQLNYLPDPYYSNGYIFGVDSLSGYVDTSYSNHHLGVTNPQSIPIYSYVFVAKTRAMRSDSFPASAVEWIGVHEMACNIGEIETVNHDSCNSNYCALWPIIFTNLYSNGIFFCGLHEKDLYDNTSSFTLKPVNLINLFNSKKNKNDNLLFSISLEKEKFLECQTLNLKIIVKNIGNTNESIDGFYYEKNIDIKDVNGNLLKYQSPKWLTDNYILILKPNEETSRNIDLLYYFGYKHLDSILYRNYWHSIYNYIPSGQYTIQYKNGNYISNEISLEILIPESSDLLELNELKSIFLMQDSEKKVDSYNNFLINYPNSKYYDLALFKYLSLKRKLNKINK